MAHSRTVLGALALALLMGTTATVSAQGLLDRMKADAQRRAENKAIRDAEHPEDSKTAAAPATAAPATTPAPAAPASPEAAPAAAATPAPPAPAQ